MPQDSCVVASLPRFWGKGKETANTAVSRAHFSGTPYSWLRNFSSSLLGQMFRARVQMEVKVS